MDQKTTITFSIPKGMSCEMREQVVKEGYGMRGKSQWVLEAVNTLLGTEGYEELVNYSDEMQDFKSVETIIVSRELKRNIGMEIIKIRKKYPTLEGVQSRILRTGIVQRLIRK